VHRWRYAAMIAAVVGAGTLVLETVRAPGPVAGDAAGTMAATGAVLDTAHFSALLSGDVTLYRDGSGAGLRVDLAASSPVEVVVVTGTQKINVHGAGLPGGGGIRTTVLLPDASRTVELTFLMGGREVGKVTLHANGAH